MCYYHFHSSIVFLTILFFLSTFLCQEINAQAIVDGRTIKCSPTDSNIYRYSDGKRRLYPISAIAGYWDSQWLTPQVVNCQNIPELPEQMIAPVDGMSVKCMQGTDKTSGDPKFIYSKVYRYMGGKRHWYPSPSIAQSWTPYWANFEFIDCKKSQEDVQMDTFSSLSAFVYNNNKLLKGNVRLVDEVSRTNCYWSLDNDQIVLHRYPTNKFIKVILDEKQRLMINYSGITGTCVAVSKSSTADGTVLIQSPCNDDLSQKWFYDTEKRLRPYHAPTKCMDSQPNGNKQLLVINECKQRINIWTNRPLTQVWTPVTTYQFLQVKGLYGWCITADSSQPLSYVSGCYEASAYRYKMTSNHIVTETVKCLSVAGSATSNGAKVTLESCNDANLSQVWTSDLEGRLHPKHAPNKCLDLQFIRKTRKEPARHIPVINECNTDINQKWAI